MPPRDDRASSRRFPRRWKHEIPEADRKTVPLREPTLPAGHVPAGELARQVMSQLDSGRACIAW
jgi:hypothetical protein